MNTTPTIKVTGDGPVVGVATARLLLQHALDTEKLEGTDETPELARKRATNELTGASTLVPPPSLPAEVAPDITAGHLERPS